MLAPRVAALILLAVAARAVAMPVTFTKVADGSSGPPGSAGTFTSLGIPAIDGGTVVFAAAQGNPYVAGVYTWSGGALHTIVDTAMPISFDLVDFWAPPTISGGNVAFMANESGGPAVWASLDGALARIAG